MIQIDCNYPNKLFFRIVSTITPTQSELKHLISVEWLIDIFRYDLVVINPLDSVNWSPPADSTCNMKKIVKISKFYKSSCYVKRQLNCILLRTIFLQLGVGLGTFRLFCNRSVPFWNEGLQLDRSVLVPFFFIVPFSFRSVPFRSVLSRRTAFPFRSVLSVLI